MPVATRGGATRDPFARMVRGIAGVEDVRDLLQIIGAAGLAANIAALHCHAKEEDEGGILAAFSKVLGE
jgi:hydroxymethylglutaryl-CoA reductase